MPLSSLLVLRNLPRMLEDPPSGSGPFAARKDDLDAHSGAITIGSTNVFTEGSPQARQGDVIGPPCAAPIAQGCPTVMINGLMAARIGDATGCGGAIAKGAAKTRIGSPGDAANNASDCLAQASAEGSSCIIFM